ncbi:phospholipase/lecithinase/hemolysin [Skermanella aerolata]|uniref:Lysophospholipase n=1 Tax=Skermanella aerolata TaxID=393310 RepID=A0A512DU45_9PROT|nr:SGNH/GDSL hydrolase family protein [Skermanella aerolata]GEO39992.1 lysophospholipase [Skermanella aerolata]
MNAFLKVSVSALALLLLPVTAQAKPFTQLVAFSGALTDTGNFSSVKGDMPAPFYKNRTTNGPVAIDVLAERLGLEAKPSMHLVKQAKKPQGTNYAVVDALAGGNGPHDLPAQISAHLDSRGGKADPDALYFVFIGGNDVVMAAMTPDPQKAEAMLDKAVAGIETAIHELVAAGARTIMAPDFIDVGMAPAVRGMGAGPQAWATRMSDSYNAKFNTMLDKVEKEKSFELIRWEFSRFVKNVAAHGEEFGFTNMTDSCMALKPAGKCDFDKFVFFNEQYPTARVHELMGSAMALAVLERPADGETEAAVAAK